MYPNGNNSQQLPYSPANDPLVEQDYAIRYNAVQEAREKENIKNQGVEERERTKLEYKLIADELKKREKHQELTGYQIVNLNEKISYIRHIYNKAEIIVLFEGIIKEVRKIVTGSHVLGYQFLVKTNASESWTGVMQEKDINNFDNLTAFLQMYMIFHRPRERKQVILDYLKDYLRTVSCTIRYVVYFPGWGIKVSSDSNGNRTMRVYKYFFHDETDDSYESEVVKRSKLNYQKKTVKDTISDVLSLFTSLGDLENAGVLFLYHLSAIFRFFLDYPLFEKDLLLIGDREQMCGISNYLKILYTFDIELIGVSKTKDLENRLMCNSDDCSLIMLNGCSTYSRKKAVEIVRNGSFQGEIGRQIRKTVPIFLSSQLLKEMDADSLMIVDLQDLSIDYSSEKVKCILGTFDKYIFDMIYKSGEYWPENLKKAFRIRVEDEQKKENKMVKMTAAFKAIARTICNMVLSVNVKELQECMELLVTSGIEKISRLNTDLFDPKVVLSNTVQNAAKSRAICFYPRLNVPDETDCLANVYYDAQYYYFPQKLMKDKIFCRIDSGIRLSLLRELKDDGILHCHNLKNNGYLISIKLTTISKKQKEVSVYAISRNFFESAYGIKLYERG